LPPFRAAFVLTLLAGPLLAQTGKGTPEGTVFSADDLQSVPRPTDPWSVLADVPGVVVDRVNVGGSDTAQQALLVSHGDNGTGAVWTIDGFDVTEDGNTFVYYYSTASSMPQLFRAQVDGDKLGNSVQLTKLNDKLIKSRAFAKTEVVRWKGADNDEVEGILYYPNPYDPAKKYPLITAIHGGPTGADLDAWGDNWAYPMNLLAQRGAFLLRPNYHGSGNYGLKWVESICCGKYYDLETPDINAGVDYLIAKGLVDPDKR
jgi:dipeptidyl aminopeptidase/acylaminoacyl peptidase